LGSRGLRIFGRRLSPKKGDSARKRGEKDKGMESYPSLHWPKTHHPGEGEGKNGGRNKGGGGGSYTPAKARGPKGVSRNHRDQETANEGVGTGSLCAPGRGGKRGEKKNFQGPSGRTVRRNCNGGREGRRTGSGFAGNEEKGGEHRSTNRP